MQKGKGPVNLDKEISLFGNPAVFNHELQAWCWKDTGEEVRYNEGSGPLGDGHKCPACFKEQNPDGTDPCIGKLPGVTAACCGHGDTTEGYIMFESGVRVGFKSARITTPETLSRFSFTLTI